MAKLRRDALRSLLLLGLVSITVTTAMTTVAVPGSDVVLTVSADRRLTLRNESAKSVSVSTDLAVERESAANVWEKQPVQNLRLRSQCSKPVPVVLLLQPGASFTALPWTGWHCASQCPESCRAEIPYPPGQYRYLITTTQGAAMRSAGFTLPDIQKQQPVR